MKCDVYAQSACFLLTAFIVSIANELEHNQRASFLLCLCADPSQALTLRQLIVYLSVFYSLHPLNVTQNIKNMSIFLYLGNFKRWKSECERLRFELSTQ